MLRHWCFVGRFRFTSRVTWIHFLRCWNWYANGLFISHHGFLFRHKKWPASSGKGSQRQHSNAAGNIVWMRMAHCYLWSRCFASGYFCPLAVAWGLRGWKVSSWMMNRQSQGDYGSYRLKRLSLHLFGQAMNIRLLSGFASSENQPGSRRASSQHEAQEHKVICRWR